MGSETILVVDDEKEIADLVEIHLVSDGFQVEKAYSAAEGLRILEKKDFLELNNYLKQRKSL